MRFDIKLPFHSQGKMVPKEEIKFNNIQDYIDYQRSNSKTYIPFQNINFIPNDCVNTSQILNWSQPWLPDYFIVENADTGDIMRWFVVESVRQRGQHPNSQNLPS